MVAVLCVCVRARVFVLNIIHFLAHNFLSFDFVSGHFGAIFSHEEYSNVQKIFIFSSACWWCCCCFCSVCMYGASHFYMCFLYDFCTRLFPFSFPIPIYFIIVIIFFPFPLVSLVFFSSFFIVLPLLVRIDEMGSFFRRNIIFCFRYNCLLQK